MTLAEFENFVASRPQPDEPGFYSLVVYRRAPWGSAGYERVLETWNNPQGLPLWRFLIERPERGMEHYATLHDAHAAMVSYAGEEDIYKFVIMRRCFGAKGLGWFYVEYWKYDAAGREYERSACSSAHYGTRTIYGQFLGRFPHQMAYRPGDIVQFGYNYRDGHEYETLAVVVGQPRSVAECMDYYQSLDEIPTSKINAGSDDDEYFLMFGPHNDTMVNYTFVNTFDISRPALPVPDEAHAALMSYFAQAQAAGEVQEL